MVKVKVRKREIFLCGKIDDKMMRKFGPALLKLEKEPFDPIKVYIKTPGGDWMRALEMHHLLHNTKSPVMTIGFGYVRSGGLLVLQGGDERNIKPGCKLVFHQVRIGMNKFLRDKLINAEQVIGIWKELVDIDSMAKYILTSRTNSPRSILKLFRKDAEINSKQALKLKIIDGIWNKPIHNP